MTAAARNKSTLGGEHIFASRKRVHYISDGLQQLFKIFIPNSSTVLTTACRKMLQSWHEAFTIEGFLTTEPGDAFPAEAEESDAKMSKLFLLR